jgi:hypothetical protein
MLSCAYLMYAISVKLRDDTLADWQMDCYAWRVFGS